MIVGKLPVVDIHIDDCHWHHFRPVNGFHPVFKKYFIEHPGKDVLPLILGNLMLLVLKLLFQFLQINAALPVQISFLP